MKLERSAGFVIFRIDPQGHRLYLLLDYGKHWDCPKGHVEPGENDYAAASRELAEETGITSVQRMGDFAAEIAYVFRNRKGGMINKTVVFFIGRTEESAVQLSDEHVGYAWLPLDDALRQLTYANARQLLKRVDTYLGSRCNRS